VEEIGFGVLCYPGYSVTEQKKPPSRIKIFVAFIESKNEDIFRVCNHLDTVLDGYLMPE
jgi:hypothetical protein